jgi:hypothetical protein
MSDRFDRKSEAARSSTLASPRYGSGYPFPVAVEAHFAPRAPQSNCPDPEIPVTFTAEHGQTRVTEAHPSSTAVQPHPVRHRS